MISGRPQRIPAALPGSSVSGKSEFIGWRQLVLAVGLGRSQILGDRVLCVQAVYSKAARALSWEGDMSSCLCVCVYEYVCQRETARDRDRDRGREEGEIPFLLPGLLPGQNEVSWFSSGRTITWRACGRGGTHRPGR